MSNSSLKPKQLNIAVSGIALVEGGPLTILLQAICAAASLTEHHFFFMVKRREGLPVHGNITYFEFPRSSDSYLRRILTEYISFWKVSKSIRSDIWISLGDTTPTVSCKLQAVYCHNPLPFLKKKLSYLQNEPNLVFRSIFYKYIYKFRCSKNQFVIAQQDWFIRALGKKLNVPKERLLTVEPEIADFLPLDVSPAVPLEISDGKNFFAFYPSLSRAFKNFEEAIEICSLAKVPLTLTLSGSENKYARSIKNRFSSEDILWEGRMEYELCLQTMRRSSVVLFPSRLETFGLPIAEAVQLGKPLVVPVTAWTLSIAGSYTNARFYRTRKEAAGFVEELKKHGQFLSAPNSKAVALKADLEKNSRTIKGFQALYKILVESMPRQSGLS